MKTKQEQKNEAYKAYEAIERQAWKSYQVIAEPALEAYQAIREPAWKSYQAKLKEIDKQEEDIIESNGR